jgi:hypothetical protein
MTEKTYTEGEADFLTFNRQRYDWSASD